MSDQAQKQKQKQVQNTQQNTQQNRYVTDAQNSTRNSMSSNAAGAAQAQNKQVQAQSGNVQYYDLSGMTNIPAEEPLTANVAQNMRRAGVPNEVIQLCGEAKWLANIIVNHSRLHPGTDNKAVARLLFTHNSSTVAMYTYPKEIVVSTGNGIRHFQTFKQIIDLLYATYNQQVADGKGVTAENLQNKRDALSGKNLRGLRKVGRQIGNALGDSLSYTGRTYSLNGDNESAADFSEYLAALFADGAPHTGSQYKFDTNSGLRVNKDDSGNVKDGSGLAYSFATNVGNDSYKSGGARNIRDVEDAYLQVCNTKNEMDYSKTGAERDMQNLNKALAVAYAKSGVTRASDWNLNEDLGGTIDQNIIQMQQVIGNKCAQEEYKIYFMAAATGTTLPAKEMQGNINEGNRYVYSWLLVAPDHLSGDVVNAIISQSYKYVSANEKKGWFKK